MKKPKNINESLAGINTILHNKNRIGIMTLLMMNDIMTFNYLKEQLQLTDGNLNSHLTTLENNQFIKADKKFVEKKPQTTYAVTSKGKKVYLEYINYLENIIKQVKKK